VVAPARLPAKRAPSIKSTLIAPDESLGCSLPSLARTAMRVSSRRKPWHGGQVAESEWSEDSYAGMASW